MVDPKSPRFEWREAIFASPPPGDGGLTSTQRLVAVALSRHMNPMGGSAFPGPTRLSRYTALHISSVKRALADLEALGWLTVVTRGSCLAGGERTANEYRATYPQNRAHSATGPTGGTGVPVAQDSRPVAQDSPTGSTGVPQTISNPYKKPGRHLSTDEFVTQFGGCQHEVTFVERASNHYDDPADVLAATVEWRKRVEAEAVA